MRSPADDAKNVSVDISPINILNKNTDGLMQKRRNSSALAMALRLFCIKASI